MKQGRPVTQLRPVAVSGDVAPLQVRRPGWFLADGCVGVVHLAVLNIAFVGGLVLGDPRLRSRRLLQVECLARARLQLVDALAVVFAGSAVAVAGVAALSLVLGCSSG